MSIKDRPERRTVGPRVLPDLLSDMIEVSVADLELAEKSRRHKVTMHVWHKSSDVRDEPCEVCLAGCVIAFTLGESPTLDLGPYSFDEATTKKLNALDDARLGLPGVALERAGLITYAHQAGDIVFPSIPSYIHEPEQFKRALLDTALVMREHGW